MRKMCCLILCGMLLLTASAFADPAEKGSFRLDSFQGGAMGIEFLEICIEDEADMVCLWTNDTVTDLVLDELVCDGDSLYSRTVWTEDTLESNQVICLQAYLGEVFPRFRVTCFNKRGERERWYVEESGKDGSLLLTEAENVEGVIPVIARGLDETEAWSAKLEDMLLNEEHSDEVYLLAAEKMLALWEEERILAWGGYAQSYAEQRWMAARGMCGEQAPEKSRNGLPEQAARVFAEALYTKAHVLRLFGVEES